MLSRMASGEIQTEELEVLNSIYEGDSAFKKISDTVFQYKYGEDGSSKSFIVEISWPPAYPDEPPEIRLDLFYNKHILAPVQASITEGMMEQAQEFLGMSMTFSLFEWVKDNLDSLLKEQPDSLGSVATVQTVMTSEAANEGETPGDTSTQKEKKEQLTKAQKRRMMDRFGASHDRPRGWDWVDIIKHLSQTGSQKVTDS